MFAAFALLLSSQTSELPFLSPIFTSHMVLQRDRTNTFWGWTKPGSAVTVSISGRKTVGRADSSGKWTVRISPPPTGGPYVVDVDGPSHAELDDVLVGDVWLCSGQSNMEMGIGMVKNSQTEIASANYSGLRLYMVKRNASLTPVAVPDGSWSVCTPENVAKDGWGGFSAAAYFFGRELHQRLHIPIGLVETCWGGTVAEAWTSRAGLTPLGDFNKQLASIDELTKTGGKSFAELYSDWFSTNDPGSKQGWESASFDDSGWKPANPSTRYEDLGLSAFDGVVWFRKEIDLPDPLPAGDALLQIGQVDDADTTWFNGVKVGEKYAVTDWRQYKIPHDLLKPGKNVVAVRVLDTGGLGGLGSQNQQIVYMPDGKQIPFGQGWRYAVGADLKSSTKLPPIFNGDPNVPTVLYNGMISPLVPLAVKGAIWYQGESNVGRAPQYERLLPAMIGDWRRNFGQGGFPFFIVQLANFSTRHTEPFDDPWAQLREAQTLTVQRVPNTGLAVAIDIGDGADIHPKDKQDVGIRLALAALKVAYGQPISYSGPIYRTARRTGNELRVAFTHTDGGLKSSADRLAGFQIAGADRKFYWADARIDGDDVVLKSDKVAEPVYARYAWDANPEATLYNGAGLPAVPFRTDR